MSPEVSAKPLALILPSDEDMRTWHALSVRQQQYALHWMRSNLRRRPETSMASIARKAREQRP